MKEFDRSGLTLRPLAERVHDLDLSIIKELAHPAEVDPKLAAVAERVVRAGQDGAAVVMMIGGHVVRSGVQPFIIDLMERGMISCLAVNGAVLIHDFELTLIGATTESVARYIRDGRFGLWKETGRINDIVSRGAAQSMGLGQAVGKAVREGDFPHKDISLAAAAYRLGVPLTAHVGIGYDITHEHPNFDGAAYGAASYRDFLRYAAVLEKLEGGVVMNFGSAVMGPEVYLKALAMVRNKAAQEGREIRRFATLVADLAPLPEDYAAQAGKDDPLYFFRPWKTMLVRTVADGGESFYVRDRHERTIPGLWSAVVKLTQGGRP